MLSHENQRRKLERLAKGLASPTPGCVNYGAMLFVARPGDVCFLAPIAPTLRGVEIVAASPDRADGRDYDIWERGQMLQSNLTVAQIGQWLQARCNYTEDQYRNHAAEWAENTLQFYGIKQRRHAQ